MKRLGILTLQLYQLLLLYNVAFTLLATFIFIWEAGTLNAEIFFSAKVCGFLAAIGLHYYSSKQTYFYFRNAGYHVITLFSSAFAFDILICSLIIALPFSHAAAYFKN